MLTLIAAHDKNRAIGKDGQIPWHAPEDLKMFKSITLGCIVIMGRKTFDSLPGGALKGRQNVVVTRGPEGVVNGVIHTSLEGALDIVRAAGKPCFCIGGGEVYRAMMSHADQMLLTHVDIEIEGADAFFPEHDAEDWMEVIRTEIRSEEPRCVLVNNIRRTRSGAPEGVVPAMEGSAANLEREIRLLEEDLTRFGHLDDPKVSEALGRLKTQVASLNELVRSPA